MTLFLQVWTFFIAYLIGVAVLWKPLPSSQKWLRFLSAPVWVSMLLHFANAAGPLRVPLFILMISVMIIGAVVQMNPMKSAECPGWFDDCLVSWKKKNVQDPFLVVSMLEIVC